MTQSNGKVMRNFIYNASYQMLCVITPLITAPYISRVLGPRGVGSFNYVQSIATYFILFGTLGSSLYGQREVAYVQDDRKKRTIVFKEIETLRIITVLVAAAIYYMAFCRSGNLRGLYLVFFIEILAAALDVSWFLRGVQDFKRAVMRNFACRIISVVSVFIFVRSSDDTVIYALCYAIPIIVGNISIWFFLSQYISNDKPDRIISNKRLLPLLALFVPQIATEVYLVLDKTMLGVLSEDMAQVGFYSQAQRLVQLALKFITALGTVMLPHVSKAFVNSDYEEIKKSIARSMRFVGFIGFPMMFGLMAVSDRFIPWFLGAGYDEVITLVNMMAPVIVIIGISNVTGTQYLLATGQQMKYTISVFAGMIANLTFNFMFIPRYGAVGATIATLTAECCVTLVQCVEVRKELPLIGSMLATYRYFLGGLVMFVLIYPMGKVLPCGMAATPIQVMMGIVVYIVLLKLFRDDMLAEGISMVTGRIRRKRLGRKK